MSEEPSTERSEPSDRFAELYGRLRDGFQRTLRPRGNVGEQAVASGAWAMAINVSDRLLQLAMVLALAAMLSPAAFGLMGIALLSVTALRRFSRIGVDAALIQRSEVDVDHYLDTAWSMEVLRGGALTAIGILAAPVVGTVFEEPAAVDLVRAISLYPLLAGLQNPGIVYLKKDLEFHRQFVYRLTGRVVHVGVALGYALVWPSVWALAVGFLAGHVAKLIVSYLIHDYRPRPGFDLSAATQLLDYGKWILGSGVLMFLLSQGDDAFVGWFLGAPALGLYQLAYRIGVAPATEIVGTVSTVAFPAYSKVQDDTASLRQGFYDTVQLTTFVAVPMATGILVVSWTVS
jgi:PST family polysaccharide transporter/lipopolysaccharide exporter